MEGADHGRSSDGLPEARRVPRRARLSPPRHPFHGRGRRRAMTSRAVAQPPPLDIGASPSSYRMRRRRRTCAGSDDGSGCHRALAEATRLRSRQPRWSHFGVLSEERSVKLPRLRGRESRFRECLDDFVGKGPRVGRQRGRIFIPSEPSANILVRSRRLTRERVGASVQVAHLLEQRLKLLVVDGHEITVLVGSRRSRPVLGRSHPPLMPRPPLVCSVASTFARNSRK